MSIIFLLFMILWFLCVVRVFCVRVVVWLLIVWFVIVVVLLRWICCVV